MLAKVDEVDKVEEVVVEELQIEVVDKDKEVVEKVDAVVKEVVEKPEEIADKVKEVVVEELKIEVVNKVKEVVKKVDKVVENENDVVAKVNKVVTKVEQVFDKVEQVAPAKEAPKFEVNGLHMRYIIMAVIFLLFLCKILNLCFYPPHKDSPPFTLMYISSGNLYRA